MYTRTEFGFTVERFWIECDTLVISVFIVGGSIRGDVASCSGINIRDANVVVNRCGHGVALGTSQLDRERVPIVGQTYAILFV